MIVIDGYQWPIPCKIERVAKVTPTDAAGMMLDRTYFNDVLGTYMEYSVALAVPNTMIDQYSTLYETLTAPVDGHQFVMPYNQSTIEITARVSEVRDVWVYAAGAKQFWRGVTFVVTANHPSKYEDLGSAITRGRAPMPEETSVPVGTLMERTSSGWELAGITDGNGMRF